MFHKLFPKEKKQLSKDKRHRRRVIHKKRLSYVCKMTYTRFYPHYPQKITEKQPRRRKRVWNGCFVDNVQREEKKRKMSNKMDK